MLPIKYIFVSPIPIKTANAAAHARQSFNSQITNLKKFKMFYKCANTILELQRIIAKNKFEIKKCKKIVWALKWAKMGF